MAGVADIKKASGVSETIIKSVFDAIVEICKTGEDVRINGVGTFSKHHKDAYTGRNPATSEPVEVAAKDTLKFKASKQLSMAVETPKAARRR